MRSAKRRRGTDGQRRSRKAVFADAGARYFRRTIASSLVVVDARRDDPVAGVHGPTTDRPASWSARSCAACRRAESESAARRRLRSSSSLNAVRFDPPPSQVHNVFNTPATLGPIVRPTSRVLIRYQPPGRDNRPSSVESRKSHLAAPTIPDSELTRLVALCPSPRLITLRDRHRAPIPLLRRHGSGAAMNVTLAGRGMDD